MSLMTIKRQVEDFTSQPLPSILSKNLNQVSDLSSSFHWHRHHHHQ